MGWLVPPVIALLLCWRGSVAGEQNEVVGSPARFRTCDSTQDTVGTCSEGNQTSSQRRARSLIQSQRSPLQQSATPDYLPVSIGGKTYGFCDEEIIGNQLPSDKVAGLDDCAESCKQELKCAFFSFTEGKCRLFEKCSSFKGEDFWTTYQINKKRCESFCAKTKVTWSQKCGWRMCEACEMGCGKPPPAVTRKRGYGHRPGEDFSQCSDATVLGLADAWYYTWAPRDSRGWKCSNEGKRVTAEFVPMVLNCDGAADEIWNNIQFYADRWKALGVKFLLGYNEPDGHIQTCSPSYGATIWLTVQKIAKYFNPPLRLVSPAPTGSDFVRGSSKWLNEFFKSCEALDGCNPGDIEMIAFHDYEGDFDTREDDNIQVRIAGAAANYKRKLWLTEFNVGCSVTSLCLDCVHNPYRNGKCSWPKDPDQSTSAEDHLSFMRKALAFLEGNEHIFRYAWFGARIEPNTFAGYSQLLPYDSPDQTLTILGEYYRDAEG